MNQNKDPAVSVIIPVYNNVAYIGEAVESVLSQTFTDWEIIIVDDGSAEDIQKAIQKYLDAHKNIHFIRQENKGPGPARNAGIRIARGKWIAFLDADDIWCTGKLEKQMSYLKDHPNTLVSGGIRQLEHRGEKPFLADSVRFFENFSTRAETLTYLLEIPYICATCSLVMSREMLEDVGLFDESLRTAEDDDLIFRLVRRYPLYSVSEVVFLRRKHNESMTTGSALEPRIQNKYKSTKKILELISDDEITKSKKAILGFWADEFAKRHLYWKQYGYAAKWYLTGMILYPQYYWGRLLNKVAKTVKR